MGIPDAILLTPARLTGDEFETMKRRTTIGAQTLEAVSAIYPRNAFLQMGMLIARSHHERWDRFDYPDGLLGEQTLLAARIMAVTDMYDALRLKRCYKAMFSHDTSRAMMLKESSMHFDPVLVDAFDRVADEFDRIRTLMNDGVDASPLPVMV